MPPIASSLALLLAALGMAADPVPPAAAPATPAHTTPLFRLTLLRYPPGLESSSAAAINEAGQIVGTVQATGAVPVVHAASWDDGAAAPVLATGPGADNALPTDIDEAGLVVGNAPTSGALMPFTWIPGQDLEAFDSPRVADESFEGLNAHGAVVGQGAAGSGLDPQPYLFLGDGAHELGLVLGDETGVALTISDEGWIVGVSGAEAARWHDGVVERLSFPGASFSIAEAVNDRGDAVGWAAAGKLVAVIWRGSSGVPLPEVDESQSLARAINDNSWVVGAIQRNHYQGPGDNFIAAPWLDERLYDLNALTIDLPAGVRLNSAVDVNDAGQIVGDATVGNTRRAFLLDPIQP